MLRVCVLVIASDGELYDQLQTLWRSRPAVAGFDVFYLRGRPGATATVCEGDTIYAPYAESLDTILEKTVAALAYLRERGYDYIFRTNLSSVIDFTAMRATLLPLPRTGLYAGFIGRFRGVVFAGGAGILMAPDVAGRLVDDSTELIGLTDRIIDDVDIGRFLAEKGIRPTPLARHDVRSKETLLRPIPPGTFHYRAKTGGARTDELFVHRILLARAMRSATHQRGDSTA